MMTTDQTEAASAGASDSVHETGTEASNTATAKVSQCPSGSRLFTGDLQVAGLLLCRCVILVACCMSKVSKTKEFLFQTNDHQAWKLNLTQAIRGWSDLILRYRFDRLDSTLRGVFRCSS